MKSWIIGILIICVFVAGGIILSTGIASDNKVPEGQEIRNPDTESPDVLPNAIDIVTTAPLADEKVSASVVGCKVYSGDYILDLRLRNPGTETRTITVDPSGWKMDLLPNQKYSYDLHLANEVSIINILVDDGTELQVQSPPCSTEGDSGNAAPGYVSKEFSPPPPVPELSPLVLTLAGISGLMVLSRRRI